MCETKLSFSQMHWFPGHGAWRHFVDYEKFATWHMVIGNSTCFMTVHVFMNDLIQKIIMDYPCSMHVLPGTRCTKNSLFFVAIEPSSRFYSNAILDYLFIGGSGY